MTNTYLISSIQPIKIKLIGAINKLNNNYIKTIINKDMYLMKFHTKIIAAYLLLTSFTLSLVLLYIAFDEDYSGGVDWVPLLVFILIAMAVGVVAFGLIIKNSVRNLVDINNEMIAIVERGNDANVRISETGGFASLSRSFNKLNDHIMSQIVKCQNLSGDVRALGNETETLSSASIESMNRQSAELDFLVSGMDQLTSTSRNVANNTQEAFDATTHAGSSVSIGTQTVTDAASQIKRLSERIENGVDELKELEDLTGNIEVIIEVINSISDQTNLLALNAAIEAARAGESGRGFAVVAEEVRTLAQRTQDSTEQIGSMINALQEKTKAVHSAMASSQKDSKVAVNLAQDTQRAFDDIGSAVEKVAQMNEQIATAAEEQRVVSDEMSKNTLTIKELCDDTLNKSKDARASMKKQNDTITNLLHEIRV